MFLSAPQPSGKAKVECSHWQATADMTVDGFRKISPVRMSSQPCVVSHPDWPAKKKRL